MWELSINLNGETNWRKVEFDKKGLNAGKLLVITQNILKRT